MIFPEIIDVMESKGILKMSNKYYTYVLIDPITETPFYVGKGQDQRMYIHEKDVLNGRIPNSTNTKLGNKIRKILKEGYQIMYKKVLESKNESNALDKEKELIAEIGLKNLCNLTKGGESGILSEETRKKLKKPHTKEHNMKVSKTRIENKTAAGKNNPMYGKSIYDVWIEKYGKNVADIKMNEYKEKHKKIHSGTKNPMYGKSVYDIWVNKYGEEEAKKKHHAANIKRSATLKKRYKND